MTRGGFSAGPAVGEALQRAGFESVGCANQGTDGVDALRAALARPKALGIPVTGAGGQHALRLRSLRLY